MTLKCYKLIMQHLFTRKRSQSLVEMKAFAICMFIDYNLGQKGMFWSKLFADHNYAFVLFV